jgi:hypothetical protein
MRIRRTEAEKAWRRREAYQRRARRNRETRASLAPVLGYVGRAPIVPVSFVGPQNRQVRIARCPYCADPHLHGVPADGHRIAHCWRPVRSNEAGYYLKLV